MKNLIALFLVFYVFNVNAQIFDFRKKKDFEIIKDSKNIADFDAYIVNHPKSKYIPEVTKKRDCLQREIDWNNIKYYDDIKHYQSYIDKYENSKIICENNIGEGIWYIEFAKKRIYEIKLEEAWKETEKCSDLICFSCYEEFNNGYPNSKYSLIAKDSIEIRKERKVWQQSKYENTVNSYNNYVDIYNYGMYSSIAKRKINEIQNWDESKKTNTHSAYIKYISDFPVSDYVDSAKNILKQIEQKDWDNAKKKNSFSSYSNFQKKYPNGFYFGDAEKGIVDIEIADIKKKSPTETMLPMEYYDWMPRDAEVSTIVMENKTIYTMTVRFSGTEGKRIKIAPNKTYTLKLKNGSYSVSASIEKSDIKPYWGTQEYKGYEYSNTWYIESRFFSGN